MKACQNYKHDGLTESGIISSNTTLSMTKVGSNSTPANDEN